MLKIASEMFYIPLKSGIYISYNTSQFTVATFQVLSDHSMWLMGAVLDGAALETLLYKIFIAALLIT